MNEDKNGILGEVRVKQGHTMKALKVICVKEFRIYIMIKTEE